MKKQTYPIAHEECLSNQYLFSLWYENHDLQIHKDIKGIKTGEFRPPKMGEWYLSGAIPECYQAKGDFTDYSFHIVRLIKVERIITEKIVEL